MSVVKVVLKDGRTHICMTVDYVNLFDDLLTGCTKNGRLVMRHPIKDINLLEIDPPEAEKGQL